MKFEFEQVKKVRVYEEIVEQLKRYFEQGNLKPGERLPSERELAEMFNCSRVSVRQALTLLEAQGLVVRKVGGGTYKADEDDYELSQLINILMPKPEDAIDDPLEVRRLMEPQIAGLAAERATEEDIALMEDCLRRQKEKLEKGELIIQEDSQFHYAIARATKNGIIIRLGEAINDMIWETRQQSIMAEQGAKRSLEGHYLIFEAIKNKDGEGASKAMEEHLREVESLMFAFNHKIEEA